MTEYLDTNVIIRFLTGDDEILYQKSLSIFKQAEQGKRQLKLLSLVIAETVFVLESFYKFDRQQIAENLQTLISQKWIDVPERKVLQKTWDWYTKNLHFVDSYLLANSLLNKGKVVSLDKKLIKSIEKV